MYAIIVDGGKQYKVTEGQTLTVDFRDAQGGDTVTFDRVLAAGEGASIKLGQPTLSGASVTAEIVDVVQGPKLTVQKFRRRKNSKRRTGHRQIHSVVKISKISV
ncbi:MAG: 50S ribosomal protein L21 [Planctomycetales bacterium]|jgi:large subunit ribosomal protein L21|nr:50S ribosomal protein L21 [Planctomycetales bacterium]MBN8627988.1 50S ribosomal protein L21 [Planctomycetota bacterium]